MGDIELQPMNDIDDDVNVDEQPLSSSWRRFLLDLGRRVAPIVIHGVAMNVFILFMALTEQTLNFTLDHAPFYFEIPIRLLVQTIDLIVLVRFTLLVWREYR